MYLATLGPQNLPLSTYFIAILEGVGGGGPSTKHTTHKQKKRSRKSATLKHRTDRTIRMYLHLVRP